MLDPTTAFAGLPSVLRAELLDAYRQILKNYGEGRWEPAELNGGKLCEVVFSIVEGAIAGSFPAKASKPVNMVDACRKLEKIPENKNLVGDRSLRILLPRMLQVLYEIRNNRGVGHVGGDVNPNKEDAEAVLAMSSWVVAELVRIFHGVSLSEAQAVVDLLSERRHPLVWVFDQDAKRVLDPDMPKAQQVLVLLSTESTWVSVQKLFEWVEYSTLSLFKLKVLKRLHTTRDVEYDAKLARVKISPKGALRIAKEASSS
jgi:hypothetical protein